MMYVFENYGYNFYSIMAFWENATFVFWLCQNSWFWVWKKSFSITIFHEKKLPFSVAPFILHLKHWNRAFEAFFVATKVHSATVPNTYIISELWCEYGVVYTFLEFKTKILKVWSVLLINQIEITKLKINCRKNIYYR